MDHIRILGQAAENVQPLSEDIERTSNSSSPTVPEQTVLGEHFQVVSLIRQDNHAAIYSVGLVKNPTSDSVQGYEARVYNLNNLSPKNERYRRRSMQRISKRAVLRVEWGDLQIIVYKTGSLNERSGHEVTSTSSGTAPVDSQEGSANKPPLSSQKHRLKSNSHVESQRLRQRDRRRASRRREGTRTVSAARGSSEPPTAPDQLSNPTNSLFEVNDSEFTMFLMLDLAYEERWQLLPPGAVPAATKSAIEQFFKPKDFSSIFPNGCSEKDLEEFIDIKEREVVFLRRQNQKFQPTLMQWRSSLEAILRRQFQIKRDSIEWVKIQKEDVIPNKHKLRALQTGLKALPGIIANADDMLKTLNQMLSEARHARLAQEKQEADAMKHSSLSRKIPNYHAWMSHVVPGSDTFFHLTKSLKEMEDELERLNLAAKDQEAN